MSKCHELGIPGRLAGSMLKLAEGSDPNLQQAQEIFEDWLTNRKITVRRAETLSGIAARNKIPLQELMDVNGLSTTFVRPGQVLKIPNGLGKRNGKGKGGGDAGGVR